MCFSNNKDGLALPAKVAVSLAVLGYIAWRSYLLVKMPYDVDELGHSHLCWLHTTGWQFLRDYYDIVRSPFLQYMLSPLFMVLGESGLLAYRAAVALMSYLALVFLFELSRVSSKSIGAAVLTTACFALSAPFIIAAQQIRYEALLLLFFLVGFLSFYRASSVSWRPLWCFSAGFFIGLSISIKVLMAPYLVAFWIVFFWQMRRERLAVILRPALMLAAGMSLPFLLLLLAYFSLLKLLIHHPEGLMYALYGMIRTVHAGLDNFLAQPYIYGETIFWGIGLIAGGLSVQRLWHRKSIVVQVHLIATLMYIVAIPLVKKQMYLQDLVFPAVSVSLFIGHASVLFIGKRGSWIKALLLLLIVVEGVLYGGRLVFEDYGNLPTARKRTALAQSKFENFGKSPGISDYFSFLNYTLPIDPYDHEKSRAEQDAGIQYFIRNMDITETAIASNNLNVFRPSAHDWATTNVVLTSYKNGLESMIEITRNIPHIWKFYRCNTNVGVLSDPRTSGIGENLVRELEHSRPKIVLVDRFLFELMKRYPAYKHIVDDNYSLDYDPESRLFFGVRTNEPWVLSGLEPLPPVQCD